MTEETLEKLFPFKRNYIELEKCRIHYVDEGEGRPLVLFHACPMWSFAYREVIREFSATHRVIAFDLPGFGLSDKPSRFDYTLNGYINITESFLAALNLTDMTFVIHGWGGTAAMGYAVRHPKHVSGLVILNSMAFSDYSIPFRLRFCRIPWLGAKLVMDWHVFLQGNLTKYKKEVAEAYKYPLQDWNARLAIYQFVKDIPMVPEADSALVMLEIEASLWMFRMKPVTLIWGMRDWLYTGRVLKAWCRYLPNAEVRTLPKAGRYLQEDAPDELIKIMREFLERNNL